MRGALFLLLLLPAAALAQHRQSDPDWPCVQRLVPRLTLEALWPGPAPEGDWRGDAALSAVVAHATARRTTEADGVSALSAFAHELDAASRRKMLPLAFAGVLEETNAQRGDLIEQIRRFTRRQRELANLSRQLAAELRSLPPNAPVEQRTELEQRRHFTAKAFEDAERTLRYTCEAPVRLEGRLGAYARTLAAALPPD